MLLQLHGIGKNKIHYKDHKDIKFDDLNAYLLLAKKAISKFANSFYHGLAAKMLKDEDAISSVANAIMMADWRWDENYKSQNGTKKNKYSYRNQCALWSIQTFVTKNKKSSKKMKDVYSLDHYFEDNQNNLLDITQDHDIQTPDEDLIAKEDNEILKTLVDNLLSLDCLTDRQKDYIKLYYFESYTFDKIGKKYGITREAVRQGLNKAIALIKASV